MSGDQVDLCQQLLNKICYNFQPTHAQQKFPILMWTANVAMEKFKITTNKNPGIEEKHIFKAHPNFLLFIHPVPVCEAHKIT